MRNMRNFFVSLSKKDITLLLMLLFLLIALPLTVFLARQRQEIRPRAKVAGGPAKLFLTAPTVPNLEVNAGQTFTVDLYLDTGGKNVSGVEAHLSYPEDLLEVVQAPSINTSAFPTILQNSAEDGKIDIAVGIALCSPAGGPCGTGFAGQSLGICCPGLTCVESGHPDEGGYCQK